MRERLNDRCRILGAATLTVALAVMVGWVRSLSLADFIGTSSDGSNCCVLSHGGLLEVQTASVIQSDEGADANELSRDLGPMARFAILVPWMVKPPRVVRGAHRLNWFENNIGFRSGGVDVTFEDFGIQKQRQWGACAFIQAHGNGYHATKFTIPYWMIQVVLLPLSACLLLRPKCQRRSRVFLVRRSCSLTDGSSLEVN